MGDGVVSEATAFFEVKPGHEKELAVASERLAAVLRGHDAGKPSWSERRRYCRDEYDDSVGCPIIEVIVARICMVTVVIVVALAIWFV